MNKAEILSPAGNKDCLIAAVGAGADAIYLAGNMFGARAYAGNFDNDELIWAIKFAHLHGRKIYLTVNTLCKNPQFKLIYDYLYPLYEAGLDAVIVQDMGVVSFIKKCFPSLEIHLSTQATITSKEAVKTLADYGIKRLVLARELTLDEIKDIYSLGVDIEIFIHGAMCYSYSGQCLFSSFLGDRSANRGRCAQPCRQMYKLEGKGKGEYILSLKDMCLAENMNEIMALGPMSLKIEGRMKDASYVGLVTGIYRRLVDEYYEKGDIKLSREDIDILDKTYVRKDRSNGYIHRFKSPEMITLDKATYNHEEKNLDDYTNIPKVKADLKAHIVEDEPSFVVLTTKYNGEEISAKVEGNMVQKANNYPLNKDDVIKRLSKSGDALIQPVVSEAELSENAYMNIKDINELRRNAIDILTNMIVKKANHNTEMCVNYYEDKDYDYKNSGNTGDLIIYVNDKDQLDECLKYDFYDAISIPSYMLNENGRGFVTDIKNKSLKLYVHLPYVIRQPQVENLSKKIDEFKDLIDGIYVNQLDSYYMVKNRFPEISIKGDINLYIYNNEAERFFDSLTTYTAPVELTRQELNHLNLSRAEMIIYGKIPFMHSANCVKNTKGQCMKGKGDINYTYLTDRQTKAEAVILHCNEDICYNTIVNGVPLCLFDRYKDVINLHTQSLCIRFTNEDTKEVRHILDEALKFKEEFGDKVTFEHTKGHFNNGIL